MMTPQEQEMERIRLLADYIANPQDMLACILLRLDSSYIYRAPHDRKTTEELLTPDLKTKAQQLHRIVGVSDLHDVLKQRICGACEFYLRRIGVDADEMRIFKATCQFDPAAFNLFAGLGPDGE
jgi:hypothetical protein